MILDGEERQGSHLGLRGEADVPGGGGEEYSSKGTSWENA